jgi:hypothetical protein
LNVNDVFRDIDELKIGDILLCHSNTSNSLVAKKIERVTGSEYCHAAIYYGDALIAESTAKNGLKKGKIGKVSISDLVSRYDHVAVLRHPDAWSSPGRIQALQQFIDKVISTGAKYNYKDALSFKIRKELHEANIHEKLSAYFDGELAPEPVDKLEYFCSEFVCDCFVNVGFIQPSAAVLFQSDTISPGDLGKDKTFGTFWGYLTVNEDYKVNESDYYYCDSTFDEIFGV